MKWYQDGNGNTSSMRIGFAICVATSSIIAILGIILDRELMGVAAIVGAVLAPTMAGKWLSGKSEVDNVTND